MASISERLRKATRAEVIQIALQAFEREQEGFGAEGDFKSVLLDDADAVVRFLGRSDRSTSEIDERIDIVTDALGHGAGGDAIDDEQASFVLITAAVGVDWSSTPVSINKDAIADVASVQLRRRGPNDHSEGGDERTELGHKSWYEELRERSGVSGLSRNLEEVIASIQSLEGEELQAVLRAIAEKAKKVDVDFEARAKLQPTAEASGASPTQQVSVENTRGKPPRDALAVEFGRYLRKLRHKAGMTQQELADQIGLYKPNISAYESGDRLPLLQNLERLAQALGVERRELERRHPKF